MHLLFRATTRDPLPFTIIFRLPAPALPRGSLFPQCCTYGVKHLLYPPIVHCFSRLHPLFLIASVNMYAAFVQFCFSITCIALISTKLVHLSIYVKSISPVAFVLFLPSLLLSDAFVICLSRLALRAKMGVINITVCVSGCILSYALDIRHYFT
jgi:hypothetical protein